MRGRRRYRAPRRPRIRIPPSASIAPVAQHRGGNPQLACDPAQRPTAAHQQSYRFPLELIGKMTSSLAHSTPFRSRWSLARWEDVEPDACEYECECCGEHQVYGAQEIALTMFDRAE